MIFFYHAEPTDAAHIHGMAEVIWHEHFDPILGKTQVDYMLDTFHTSASIAADMEGGYEYYIIRRLDAGETHDCGYTAFKKLDNRIFVSKIYLFKEFRGQGIFRATVKDLYLPKAKLWEVCALYLAVNKNNTASIHAYESVGFKKIQSVTEDIGNGFVKDDYVMELGV